MDNELRRARDKIRRYYTTHKARGNMEDAYDMANVLDLINSVLGEPSETDRTCAKCGTEYKANMGNTFICPICREVTWTKG